jgi:hypothetical protein
MIKVIGKKIIKIMGPLNIMDVLSQIIDAGHGYGVFQSRRNYIGIMNILRGINNGILIGIGRIHRVPKFL